MAATGLPRSKAALTLGRTGRKCGCGVTPEVGEEAASHGELPARHGDGAVMKVDAERELDGIVEHAARLHVVGERAVAIAGALLGSGHRLVDSDRLVVGDPALPTTDLGPLIEQSAQSRLNEARQYARRVGSIAYEYPQSRLPLEGYYAGPTLVADISAADRLAREELFGPLVCLFRVKNIEEALALANASDYALTGAIYTRSPSHMTEAMQSFDVGNLYINRPTTGAMVGRQPFGGHKLSGLGTKAGGPDYLLQLPIPKPIAINPARHGTPLE